MLRRTFKTTLVSFSTVLLLACAMYVSYGWWVDFIKSTAAPAPKPSPSPTDVPLEPIPDTSRILPLIGRHSAAHGCPVAPSVILSNQHVFDVFESNPSMPTFPYMFSTLGGTTSLVYPWNGYQFADLAAGLTLADIDYYPIASVPPLRGERLWWVGYDWRTQQDFMSPRVFSAQVVRVVAGQIVMNAPALEGSSGSCILNARGEAVGIVAWRMNPDDGKPVALGPGIWGTITSRLIDGWQDNTTLFRQKYLAGEIQ